MKEIKSPRCGNTEIWKSRKPRGKQQYQCKKCIGKFTTELNYDKEFKWRSIQIFYEENSGRTVGRILGTSKNICLYLVKKYAKEIKPKNKANEGVEVIEMDKIYSFVEGKKQNLCDDTSEQR